MIAALWLGGLALGTIVEDLSLDEVLARADSVVVATVQSQRVVDGGGIPITETTVRVERVLVGPSEATLVISQLGGGDAYVAGTPRFTLGSRVLLATDNRDGRRRIIGLSLGMWVMSGERGVQSIDVPLARPGRALRPAPGRRELTLRDVEAALARVR
jgi:hypothetical protein